MMAEKEALIADFERDFWAIDEGIKEMMLRLPLRSLILKLEEWREWSLLKGVAEF